MAHDINFGKIVNYGRYCDQHHLATSGPAISCQTAILLGRLSLRYQTANVAKILNKNGLRLSNEYRLCHSSANFEMSAKIMLVSSNYAKNYASTIYMCG